MRQDMKASVRRYPREVLQQMIDDAEERSRWARQKGLIYYSEEQEKQAEKYRRQMVRQYGE